MVKLVVLTGQRFGRLAVFCRSVRVGGVYWWCQCDCGRVVEVAAGSLRSGHTKSCGCLRKIAIDTRSKRDITGERCGRLTAFRPTQKRRDGSVVWKCRCDCGEFVEVSVKDFKPHRVRSCGCLNQEMRVSRRGRAHPLWRGGRTVADKGYIRVLCSDHPYADHNGYVLEHRLVMEAMIGRYLRPEEIVHHVNGVKDDNRRVNLMLFGRKREHRTYHRLMERLMFLLMRRVVFLVLKMKGVRRL